jgi:ribosomal protein S18 acetylase RimI-like enzyme
MGIISMPAESLIRLQKDQIGPAAEMLARAFRLDPKMAHFIKDEAMREELSRHVLEFELRYGMRYGEVYATSPGMEGVAVWLPSDKAEITFLRALLVGALKLRRDIGPANLQTVLDFSDNIDAIHRHCVTGPHWYLFFIGVAPEHQGKGYARRLIRPMLARLDREGLSCYLVTENEKNVALYEHYGFAVVNRSTIPGTTVNNWAMLRKASR